MYYQEILTRFFTNSYFYSEYQLSPWKVNQLLPAATIYAIHPPSASEEICFGVDSKSKPIFGFKHKLLKARKYLHVVSVK